MVATRVFFAWLIVFTLSSGLPCQGLEIQALEEFIDTNETREPPSLKDVVLSETTDENQNKIYFITGKLLESTGTVKQFKIKADASEIFSGVPFRLEIPGEHVFGLQVMQISLVPENEMFTFGLFRQGTDDYFYSYSSPLCRVNQGYSFYFSACGDALTVLKEKVHRITKVGLGIFEYYMLRSNKTYYVDVDQECAPGSTITDFGDRIAQCLSRLALLKDDKVEEFVVTKTYAEPHFGHAATAVFKIWGKPAADEGAIPPLDCSPVQDSPSSENLAVNEQAPPSHKRYTAQNSRPTLASSWTSVFE